jgi:hypothetical protein
MQQVDEDVVKMSTVLRDTLNERSRALNTCREMENELNKLQQGYKFEPLEDISVRYYN